MAATTTNSDSKKNGHGKGKAKNGAPPPVKAKGDSPLEGPAVPARAGKGKGPKQLPIPGTERKTPPAIEKAVLAYREARDERMELTKVEQAAYAKLVTVLADNGIDLKDGQNYEFRDEDGRVVKVVAEIEPETVKVRVKTGKSDDGED